jgi:hypothetical protein
MKWVEGDSEKKSLSDNKQVLNKMSHWWAKVVWNAEGDKLNKI